MPSSVVSRFRYDEQSRNLYIWFVSGNLYRYRNVPKHLYDGMRRAISKGSFFNRKIKNSFEFDRLSDPQA